MTIDLEQSLARLAQSVHDDGAAERMSGQVRTLVGRIRRRRAARYTANGVVGVAAAGAVVVGGTQLAGVRETAPPPAVQPVGDGFTRCGALATDPNPEMSWVVSLRLWTGAADSEGRPDSLPVGVSLEGQTSEVVAVHGEPRVVVTRDDVVVSVPAVIESATAAGADAAMPSSWSLQQSFASCDPGTFGEPLPGGSYELAALQTVEFGEGGPVDLFTSIPLSLEEPAPDPTAEPSEGPTDPEADAEGDRDLAQAQATLEAHLAAPSSEPFPACRSAVLSRSGDVLALDLALEDRPYARSEQVAGEVTVRTVDGRSVIGQAPTSGARLVLTRGGMVVGGTYSDPEDVDLLGLGPEETATVPLYGAMSLCAEPLTDAAQPGLPPGVYEAYAVMEVMLKEVTDASGEATSRSDLVLAVSQPVMVTVE